MHYYICTYIKKNQRGLSGTKKNNNNYAYSSKLFFLFLLLTVKMKQ